MTLLNSVSVFSRLLCGFVLNLNTIVWILKREKQFFSGQSRKLANNQSSVEKLTFAVCQWKYFDHLEALSVVVFRPRCASFCYSATKMSDSELNTVFKSFCAFGAGGKDAQPMMDNAKFGKLFRDLKLYDKKFTSTDTDIIFNRPEVKG